MRKDEGPFKSPILNAISELIAFGIIAYVVIVLVLFALMMFLPLKKSHGACCPSQVSMTKVVYQKDFKKYHTFGGR